MAENSNPATDEVEREFAETLQGAAFIFEKEENGRFQGSILACRAVARFIYQRNGGAELAAPFMQIAAAFEELERGGKARMSGDGPPYIRVGCSIRYSEAALLQWIKSRQRLSTSEQ
jgi:hypothetical protein